MPLTSKTSVSQGRGTTVTCAWPAGTVAGDYALLCVGTVGAGSYGSGPNQPGWSPVGFVNSGTSGTSSTGTRTMVWAKRVTAGDLSNPAGYVLPATADWMATVVAISGLKSGKELTKAIVHGNMTPPRSLVLTRFGTAGTKTYTYVVTAKDASGNTLKSATATITTAPNVLDNTNYVKIAFDPIGRALSYDIFRGDSAGTETYLTTVGNDPGVPGPGANGDNVGGGYSDQKRGYLDKGAATPDGVTYPPTMIPSAFAIDPLPPKYPAALRIPYESGHLIAVATVRSTGDVTGGFTFTPSHGSVLASVSHTNKKLAMVVTAEEISGPAPITQTRSVAHNGTNGPHSVVQMVLRPATSNAKPTAIPRALPPAKFAGEVVYLNGAGSRDIDNDTLTYQWTQTAGPAVTLTNPTSKTPSFTMPSASVSFSLVVSDGTLQSDPSSVTYTVATGPAPPLTPSA